ncbi:hypothetical protein ACOJQI_10640 [Bacillus salacetis]|uniref:hypothetical protein n=1 Tax=Bacillus salacetis TaxID=2315464 RepID=UPI003B9F0CBF
MKKNNYITIVRLFAAGVISSSIILGGCRLETETENEVQEVTNEQSEETTTGAVTLEMYNQLEKGMRYEEVREIIGFDPLEPVEEADESSSSRFTWPGESEQAFLTVAFKKNKLSTKTQMGLR